MDMTHKSNSVGLVGLGNDRKGKEMKENIN